MAYKYLVIVESPTKAKTIDKYLGRNYKVVASKGHLRDLPKSKMGIDFENNFDQKQKAYNTTDLGYSHKIDKFTLFAQVNNVFDKKNGLWIEDDAIYPVNFTRTWYAGVRASF